jgi:DNA polymerase (family 10)
MEDKYSNRAVSRLLKSISVAYTLNKENRFRIVAYEKAADAVEHLAREVMDIWKEGKLEEVPGIGQSIYSHLDEYFKKGKSTHFDKVLSKIPKAVFILMEVPTLGPKKAYRLFN